MFDYNLVQPTDDLLDSELVSLQATDIMGKEFIFVTDAEEFYKKYSYCMGFSMRKDRVSRDTHGLITIRRWVCSKEWYRSKNFFDRIDRVREPREQTQEGCRASFRINLDRDKMLLVVTEFVTEHSHMLSPGNHRQFLRSHRNVKDSDLAQVQSLRSVGMKTSQVMDQLVDQAGSYAAVGHTVKDLQNRLDTIRRSASHNSDADSLISYMTAKSEMDQRFFFRYIILEDGSMGNLFWSDSMSRCDYIYFGDVISFDSTYRTNCYNRPLVIFVGVNNHTKTIIFGFGLLVDETVETYTWILQTFLEVMHGKCPISVVTDGDRAMAECPDERSTQRSESINSFLNRFMNRRLKLYEFMSHIDRAMSRLRNNEMKDDFDTINEHQVLVTHLLQLEKHDAEVYTHNTFARVRDEIKSEAKLSIVNCVNDMDSVMYTFKKFAVGDKTWNVSVMKAMNQHHIPETLIMQRWTKNVKDVSELDSSSTVTTTDIIQLARYRALSSKCSKMSYFASMSNEGYKEANAAIDNIARKDNVHQSKTESSVQVKDPVAVAAKGSSKQKTKSSGKAHKCGNCGQPGHKKKTCHAHVKNDISAMASNGAATTRSTLQPIEYADLVQSCDSEFIVDSDGCCQPFAFHNYEVPMGNLSNQSADNVLSMTNSTQAMTCNNLNGGGCKT
ncbi:hypothetical protein EZV62_018526 [Acer yangbiense]|uniref:CCHC-type domain-containing protein n=1 Tax=Acer yangbiense TaxID=1000413 RepID=A0A5C7HJI7_9ROSI|nr:hypothetical protein EZV62_018526 [Acer yangbiense]